MAGVRGIVASASEALHSPGSGTRLKRCCNGSSGHGGGSKEDGGELHGESFGDDMDASNDSCETAAME